MIDVIITYTKLLLFLFQHKRFLNQYIKTQLNSFTQLYTIDKKVISKIYSYYGLGIPTMLGLLYALPRGYKISKKERFALTYMGALTGIIDDAFDENLMNTQRVLEFIKNPDAFIPQTDNEQLMSFLGKLLLQNIPEKHKEIFFRDVLLVFNLQIKSLEQKNPSIDNNDLIEITRLKGGHPFVLYRYCLENDFVLNEYQLIYELGASMQLGNDIFDVYKDYNDGIFTLANTTSDLNHLESLLFNWMQQVLHLSNKTSFKSNSDEVKFRNYFLFGMSRCFVCIDQFKILSPNSNFEIAKHARNELICDMEKFSNICKSIRWYSKLKKQFV